MVVVGEGVMVVMLVRVSTEVVQRQNPSRWVRNMRWTSRKLVEKVMV